MASLVGATAGGNGNAVSFDLTWPSGVQANDAAFFFWVMVNTATPNTPTGFTVPSGGAVDGDSGSIRLRFGFKVCAGSESGSLTFGNSNAVFNRQSACLIVYRGIDPSSPINAFSVRDEGVSTTSHVCPAVTPTVADAPVVVFAGERFSSGTTNWTISTYTERGDSGAASAGSGGTSCAVADDGLGVARAANVAVNPPNWVGQVATDNVFTLTMAMTPLATEFAGWGIPI